MFLIMKLASINVGNLKMNKNQIKSLQNIIMGYEYSESIINLALAVAESFEVKVLLKALKGGRCSFESRMTLQTFVCQLSAK